MLQQLTSLAFLMLLLVVWVFPALNSLTAQGTGWYGKRKRKRIYLGDGGSLNSLHKPQSYPQRGFLDIEGDSLSCDQ